MVSNSKRFTDHTSLSYLQLQKRGDIYVCACVSVRERKKERVKGEKGINKAQLILESLCVCAAHVCANGFLYVPAISAHRSMKPVC